MNHDELKKYMASWDEYWNSDEGKEIRKQIQDEMNEQAAKMNSYSWGPSLVSASYTKQNSPWSSVYGGISPTDKDARGMYEYQEPEVDEQGTFYGYKVLNQRGHNRGGEITFISPRYPAEWLHGQCRADMTPDERHMHGLHFTKRIDHPELRNYFSNWENSVIVKCALSGTVVETDQGWRAEYAQIIGVYINGNWQSYQDYQERARTYPSGISDQEEIGWRYISNYPRQSRKGIWNISFDFGPNP